MLVLRKLLTGEWVDPVTRLPNEDFMNNVLAELSKGPEVFHVINVRTKFNSQDEYLDGFVLSRVAAVLKHSVRIPKDFVCKSGKDSFCVILHGVGDIEVEKIAGRIKDSLQYLLLTYGAEKIQIDCEVEVSKIGGAR